MKSSTLDANLKQICFFSGEEKQQTFIKSIHVLRKAHINETANQNLIIEASPFAPMGKR